MSYDWTQKKDALDLTAILVLVTALRELGAATSYSQNRQPRDFPYMAIRAYGLLVLLFCF